MLGRLALLCLGALCLVSAVTCDADTHWHYNHDGAAHWMDDYTNCGKDNQSPVNISSQDSQIDYTIPDFLYSNYDTTIGVTMRIKNNGHTAQVDIETGDVTINNGGLTQPYQAAQFHFHWGSTNTQGSEHKVDGVAYPMELHIVHYKRSLQSVVTAVSQSQGLAVLGFFFEISEEDNEAYKNIIEALPQITQPNTSIAMPAVPLESLLPGVKNNFYRYEGSLTTPTCDQTVIWTVFADPIKISQTQLDAFRQLISAEEADDGTYLPMVDNYRPVQPLNSRVVRKNFEECLVSSDPKACSGKLGNFALCAPECQDGKYVTCDDGGMYIRYCNDGWYLNELGSLVRWAQVFDPSVDSCRDSSKYCPRPLDSRIAG